SSSGMPTLFGPASPPQQGSRPTERLRTGTRPENRGMTYITIVDVSAHNRNHTFTVFDGVIDLPVTHLQLRTGEAARCLRGGKTQRMKGWQPLHQSEWSRVIKRK